MLVSLSLLMPAGIRAEQRQDTAGWLRLYFLYGSRPKSGHRNTEKRVFGGLHGGHVSLVLKHEDIGFERAGGFHVFPRPQRKKARFRARSHDSVVVENQSSKTAMILIPLSDQQQSLLDSLLGAYRSAPPYDYAFFGMRCAAATQEILSLIGVLKKRSRAAHLVSAFYPKPFRKRMLELARSRHWKIITTPGRPSRRWEKD